MNLRQRYGRIAVAVGVFAAIGVVFTAAPEVMGWMDGMAAREAVRRSLEALPRVADPKWPLPEGRQASPQEQAELQNAARSFLEALSSADYEAAWSLVDPDTLGAWTQETWLEFIAENVAKSGEDDEFSDWRMEEYLLPMLMFSGNELEVLEVQTWADEGLARLVVTIPWPIGLALVRTETGWCVDLTATDTMQARRAVQEQLQGFGAGEGMNFFKMIMAMEGGMFHPSFLGMIPPDAESNITLEQCVVLPEENRAAVVVHGNVQQHIALPLANGDRGWSIAWCRKVRIIPADAPLEGVARTNGTGARNACASNLKQLALAALMYAQDYDQHFPPADRWCTVTEPYVRDTTVYHCPADSAEGGYGYAMNFKLSRMPLGRVDAPAETVLFFESRLNRKDAYDRKEYPDHEPYPGDSLALPPGTGTITTMPLPTAT